MGWTMSPGTRRTSFWLASARRRSRIAPRASPVRAAGSAGSAASVTVARSRGAICGGGAGRVSLCVDVR
eukprot:7381028-Prymnesium_polylepis.1